MTFTAESAEYTEVHEEERLNKITEAIIGVAIEKLLPIHQAQLMSYLKLSSCRIGLLINFNVKVLKNGIQRVVNNFPDSLR